MAEKDLISKDVLQFLAADIANILLHLDVDKNSVELLPTEQQRIESRRADMVARMRKCESGERFILHVEIQNANDSSMPIRMLRYLSDILMMYPDEPIYQYLVYIGKQRLTMPSTLPLVRFTYDYQVLDMHTVDCSLLLAQDTPEALVLAILCDFKERPTQQVVNYIVRRLRELTGDDEQSFRNYYEMLETLGDNRDLQAHLVEAKTMLTQVDITRFSTYVWGKEDGIKQGLEQGLEQGFDQGLQKGITQARSELEPLLTEKELALQKEQQRIHQAVKQLLALNAMSYQAIADLFQLTLEQVEAIAQETKPTQH
ncbi:MAG: hypothetical protein WAQ53_05010 [Thiofilum sp.]|uniref:hypothetical protein n=1 Tax=Thiofilum sp. TaxID=2212733 RepID=UPI002600366F|nr:hypothetical protein [Thiofilum sp.]MBK8452283.1 hypothetical protein [Thiofilum sp.]